MTPLEQHQWVVKLGQELKRVRRDNGVTLDELSLKAGLSKGNLSDIENGKKDCRFVTLLRISMALNVSLSELLSTF